MFQFHERQQLIWDSVLSSTQKFILLAYDSYGDSEGESIYPSYATIAQKTSFDSRTVIRTVNELCKLGIMGKLNRTKENGGTTSNRYKIYFGRLKNVAKPSDPRSSPPMIDDHPPSDRGSLPPMIDDHPPYDRRSPDQSNRSNQLDQPRERKNARSNFQNSSCGVSTNEQSTPVNKNSLNSQTATPPCSAPPPLSSNIQPFVPLPPVSPSQGLSGYIPPIQEQKWTAAINANKPEKWAHLYPGWTFSTDLRLGVYGYLKAWQCTEDEAIDRIVAALQWIRISPNDREKYFRNLDFSPRQMFNADKLPLLEFADKAMRQNLNAVAVAESGLSEKDIEMKQAEARALKAMAERKEFLRQSRLKEQRHA